MFAQKLQAGRAALEALERGLAGREFVAGGRYTVADISLYAYTHLAIEAGIELSAFPGRRSDGSARVEAQPGFVNDLAPYPPNAWVGAGDRSVHDPPQPS